MMGDRRWYFTDKDNVKAFFPPLPLAIYKELDRSSQQKLAKWRKEMIKACKERGMKPIITEMIEASRRRAPRKVGMVGTDGDDDYESMALDYCGEDGRSEDNVESFAFNKIGIESHVVERVGDISDIGPQPSPVTRNKADYFWLYSFYIGGIVEDRDPVDILDSGAETPLLGPGWTIVHTYDSTVGVTLALPDSTKEHRRMEVVDAFRLYTTCSGIIVKFTIKKAINATEYASIDSLLNPHLLREAGVYVHDVAWKFGGKQCIEKNGVSIPLKYLPSRGKMFLDPLYDSAIKPTIEIIVDPGNLSSTIEEPLALSKVSVHEIQRILGGPSELCVKKTLENTTRLYDNGGDRVSGVLHPRSHVKKRLTKLAARRIGGTVCTDTVFAKPVTSMRGFNYFQLF